jgi:magnesium transporter
MKKSKRNYLKYLNPIELLQTKKLLKVNPTTQVEKEEFRDTEITLYSYNEKISTCSPNINKAAITRGMFKPELTHWLNLDIINKTVVEELGAKLSLHPLLIEDIVSVQQRPKVEDIDNSFTCVLQMLYFNEESKTIESEQISFLLGENYVVSFQDDATRDLFDNLRGRLKTEGTKIRSEKSDYLLYAMLDCIVDSYFIVLEKLAELIERLEEDILKGSESDYEMNRINNLRKELIFFKRNTAPVRELIGNIIRNDHPYFSERNKKYYNDIYDHTIQVIELTENYRDVLTNVRDLYLSQVNLRLNQVMKFLAIVTTLLAPATVIGGIFGMNFDRIPYLHHQNGFWIATILMIIAPLLMLIYFRRKGWF